MRAGKLKSIGIMGEQGNMPFMPDCLAKHRDQAHLMCGACSDNHSFALTSLGEIGVIADEIIGCAMRFPEWRPHRARTAYIVTLIINETCMNAVEHGALGIDKRQKRKLIAEQGEKYIEWVETQWLAKNVPLSVTACINGQRILIGVHDGGTGFDASKHELSAIGNADLMELSGRGMAILKGMGVQLSWNEEGNTILCSLKNFIG